MTLPLISALILGPIIYSMIKKRYTRLSFYLITSSVFILMVLTLVVLPDITFNEARDTVSSETDSQWTLQLKRYGGDASLFYKGHYLITTTSDDYLFDFNDNTYERSHDEL
jgi:hypothetical protein